MRIVPILALVAAAIVLTGCDYRFTFHPEMTDEEMVQRSDLVFIGVIESQHFDYYPFFRGPKVNRTEDDLKWWRPLRRRVRVEADLHGSYPQKEIDVYEILLDWSRCCQFE